MFIYLFIYLFIEGLCYSPVNSTGSHQARLFPQQGGFERQKLPVTHGHLGRQPVRHSWLSQVARLTETGGLSVRPIWQVNRQGRCRATRPLALWVLTENVIKDTLSVRSSALTTSAGHWGTVPRPTFDLLVRRTGTRHGIGQRLA